MLEHRGPIIAEPPDAPLTVISCEQCGFAHVMPLPTAEETDAYYRTNRLSDEHAPDDWFLHEAAQQFYWSRVYKDWLSTLKRLLTDIELVRYDRKPRLFDIGAGAGWLLKYADDTGWQTSGIEPSPKARALCEDKGLGHVSDCSLYDYEKNYFHAVTLSLVLEHVVEPKQMLVDVRNALKDDGLVLLTVPSDFTSIQEIARKKYDLPAWWVCAPHISYFSIDSIQALVRRAGFEIVDTWCQFPIEMMALMGWPYVDDEDLGRWCYKRKMEFEMAYYEAGKASELRRLQHAWCDAGIGREVVVVGRKV